MVRGRCGRTLCLAGLSAILFACSSSSPSPAGGDAAAATSDAAGVTGPTDAASSAMPEAATATDASAMTGLMLLPGPTGLGDSCNFDSDCPMGGSCDLVCVAPCSTDADCAGSHGSGRNAQGVQNRCVQTLDPISNTISLTCAPGCNTQNECNPLGLLCKPAPDGDAGTAVNICEQV